MKKTMLALLLLSCGTLFAETHFSVGIGIGGYGPVYSRVPPPPPVYAQPPCPGDGYEWVDGYWYPVGPRFYWRMGYWRAPAYVEYGGGYGRGYGYGWRERGGYERHERYEGYDRGRRGYGGEERGRYRGNEFRHEGRGRRGEGR